MSKPIGDFIYIHDQFGPALPAAVDVKTAWDTQVGGDHYRKFAIQPSEYIDKNGFDWYDGNALKYISRHKVKNGPTDLKKAIQYIQAQLEKSYNIKSTVTYEG
jgi:hypothetical protein